jgi:predicted HTH transcriptional regulator
LDDNIRALVLSPREGRAVELKRWLNTSTPAHQAKIIRACAAIYNSNGGYVLIGFNDDESPDRDHIPQDWEREYESERIQQIVANHTSPPIEVSVYHARVDDIVCVVGSRWSYHSIVHKE